MAAPPFIPKNPNHRPRSYSSPPGREFSWDASRPAELVDDADQPQVALKGTGEPGPDSGYAFKFLALLRDQLVLAKGEDRRDAEAGGLAIALKRASIFGRSPILEDLEAAYRAWGLLNANAPSELVAERVRRFEGVHHSAHHYPELRAVVDTVPDSTLVLSPAEIDARSAGGGWNSLLSL